MNTVNNTMSTIRVHCPKCQATVELEKELLARTNGHAVCPECTHTFKLVRKAKPAAAAPEAPAAAAEKTAAKSRRPGFLDALRKPLSYRVPKAPAKKEPFAEVGEEPITFNLLDRDSVGRHMPVAVKPSGSSSITHAPMQQDGQQNHITIHTDSLVFTLMGDNQQNPSGGAHPIALAPGGHPLPAPAGSPPVAAAANAVSETNWTIATIVALVILLIQLFNLILMLI